MEKSIYEPPRQRATQIKMFNPKQHHYRRGRRYEYKVMHQLSREGFYVMRSAGSKGMWDLIAVNPAGMVRLIQCKVNSTLSHRDRALMEQFPVPCSWQKELWSFKKRGPPEIQQIGTRVIIENAKEMMGDPTQRVLG